jgi:hypothetical protein
MVLAAIAIAVVYGALALTDKLGRWLAARLNKPE